MSKRSRDAKKFRRKFKVAMQQVVEEELRNFAYNLIAYGYAEINVDRLVSLICEEPK